MASNDTPPINADALMEGMEQLSTLTVAIGRWRSELTEAGFSEGAAEDIICTWWAGLQAQNVAKLMGGGGSAQLLQALASMSGAGSRRRV